MGDLARDTAVTPAGDGNYRADLSSDWEIWGPNGGYLAAVAMRAAGAEMGRARPASINAHFGGSGQSAPVDISVTTNRATRVATSVTVTITQAGRPWLVANVWGIDDGLPGLDHHAEHRAAEMAAANTLPSVRDLAPADAPPPHPFWANLDTRPLTWIADWQNRSPSAAEIWSWYRFEPAATFVDPWIDACRSLILIDLDGWPAAGRPHVGEPEVYAPTIEVTARFVRATGDEPWLLSHATAPVAANGLIAAVGEVFDADRRLVAVGGSTLLCRPAARRPDRE